MPRFIEVLRSEPRYGLYSELESCCSADSLSEKPDGTSLALGLQIYDSQCGAKMFRGTFLAGWAFDVEIIARLIASPRHRGSSSVSEVIYELPLRRCRDVPGSKVRPSDFVVAVWDLVRIYWRYLRR